MGCCGSNTTDENPRNKSISNKNIKRLGSGAEVNNEEDEAKIRGPVDCKKNILILGYYNLEILTKTEIKIREIELFEEERDDKKKNLMIYLKSDSMPNSIKKLSQDKLEFMIYIFNYNTGKQKICNYYEADEVKLSCEQLNKNDLFVEKQASTRVVQEIELNVVANNDDEYKPLLIQNIDQKPIEQVEINSPVKESKFDNEEFVYCVWLLDIEAVDIDPNSVIQLIEGRESIKNMAFYCEDLGDVYIEEDPDLNDNGEVNYDPPQDAEKIQIYSKNIDDALVDEVKQNIESDAVHEVSIIKCKYANNEVLDNLFNVITQVRPEKLTVLTLSDNLNLGDYWFSIIAFIGKLPNIYYLNLSMGFIYDKYLTSLFTVIKKKRIISLDLSSNFITFVGARIVGKWLKSNRTIKELNIQQNTMNEFKREGFDFIAEPLKSHPQITTIDFSFMVLTGFGKKLSELIRQSNTIKVLKIKATRMNFNDYEFVFPALYENKVIEQLFISENNPMKEESIDMISKLINVNRTINTLYIDKVGLTIENSKPFFTALKKNEVINCLSMNDNPELSVRKLYEFFKEQKTIKKLCLMIRNSNAKRTKDEIKLLEKLKEERQDDLELKF